MSEISKQATSTLLQPILTNTFILVKIYLLLFLIVAIYKITRFAKLSYKSMNLINLKEKDEPIGTNV